MMRKTSLKLLTAALLWGVTAVLVPLALGAAFQAMFNAWNVNVDTVTRAPIWAQWVYTWHGSFITLISDGLLIALCVIAFHAQIERPNKRDGLSALVGFGIAILLAVLFTLLDSLRPEHPPHFSLGLIPLCGLMLISVLAEELLTKRVLYDTVSAKWGKLPATIAATLAFFLIGGGLGGTIISGVNVALLGLLCCLLYDREGLWTPVLFRWGWGFATVFLLGQGGGDHSVWRFYGVSETLLTGGDSGFACGLMWTAILMALNMWMIFKQQRVSKDSGNTKRQFNFQFSIFNSKTKKG